VARRERARLIGDRRVEIVEAGVELHAEVFFDAALDAHRFQRVASELDEAGARADPSDWDAERLRPYLANYRFTVERSAGKLLCERAAHDLAARCARHLRLCQRNEVIDRKARELADARADRREHGVHTTFGDIEQERLLALRTRIPTPGDDHQPDLLVRISI